MQANYTLVSGIIFGIVALIQALRLVNQWAVQIGPIAVPMWFSGVALAVGGGLCMWAFSARGR